MRRLALVAALVVLVVPAIAFADGDPASDYLLVQSAFLPFDAHVDRSSAVELNTLLVASKKAGFPLRVAVISSKVDLGAVPILFGRPQTYAKFLGQELFYWYKHELLVVMPNGYGVYDHGVVPAKDRAALEKLPVPHTTAGTPLVQAAITAARALADAHAVSLPHTSNTSTSSSGPNWTLVAGGVAAAIVLVGGLIFVQRRR